MVSLSRSSYNHGNPLLPWFIHDFRTWSPIDMDFMFTVPKQEVRVYNSTLEQSHIDFKYLIPKLLAFFVCIPFFTSKMIARFLWSPKHESWTQIEYRRVLFSAMNKILHVEWFSSNLYLRRTWNWLSSFLCKKREKIDTFSCKGIFVWGYIMLSSQKPMHVFYAGIVNTHSYRYEVLKDYVMLFRCVVGQGSIFMDDNAKPHISHIFDYLLKKRTVPLWFIPRGRQILVIMTMFARV